MFICKKCLGKKDDEELNGYVSYGICEVCEKEGECKDEH